MITPRVNLLPKDRKVGRARRLRVRHWLGWFSAYGVLVMIIGLSVRFGWAGADPVLAHELIEGRERVEETQLAVDRFRPRLVEARATLAASDRIGKKPDWSVLLSLLANLLEDRSMLTRVKIEPIDNSGAIGLATAQDFDPTQTTREYRINLEGLAFSHAGVSSYVLQLEQQRLFASVKLIDTRKQTFQSGEAVSFRIELLLSDKAAPSAWGAVR